MTDYPTTAIDSNDATLAHSAADIALAADYELFKKILAEEDEALPEMGSRGLLCGEAAFDSRNYATEAQADAAMEAFLIEALGASDERE